MLVALDVGNTNIRLGVVRDGDVTSSRGAPTPPVTTEHELETTLRTLLAEDGKSLVDLEEIALVSVVPAVTSAISEVAGRAGIPLLVADAMNMPMPFRVDFPSGVGNDRLVNAFAAARLYGTPAIVVDLGTATTFDVVAADGAFIGGAIAPGIGLGLDALASHTAQLPRVAIALPPLTIGRNTVEAMQSGGVLGYVGLVEKLLAGISDELAIDGGTRPKVILTGGQANLPWTEAIPRVDAVDLLLTLRGLAILHRHVAWWESVGSV